jgi:hypothetical protein
LPLSAEGRLGSLPEQKLTLRLSVLEPCEGVAYALQRGRADVEQRQVAGKQAFEFEFVRRVGTSG